MKQLPPQNSFFMNVVSTGAVFTSRLGILPANISPLGSFGFFGNPVLFGLSILAFDFAVKGIYPGFWLTYLGFACYPFLGRLAKGSLPKQLLLLPSASFMFFILSNAGVWWYWYDHTLSGLLACYALAIPFYTRTLLSDIGFGYSYLIVRYLFKHEPVSSVHPQLV
jgi:hypothetical protein